MYGQLFFLFSIEANSFSMAETADPYKNIYTSDSHLQQYTKMILKLILDLNIQVNSWNLYEKM